MQTCMAQLMPLSLAVSCFIKIQIGFTFLVPAHLGSPRKGPLNGCVCVTGLQFYGHYTSQTCASWNCLKNLCWMNKGSSRATGAVHLLISALFHSAL